MRILLVEDSPRMRQNIGAALRRTGYAVDLAADGEEGLWQAESHDYDVIILDLMLPKLDGLSLLKKLRTQGRKNHVLLLTAKDTVPDRVRGLQAGADDYLVKPFALEELLARIHALCRRSYHSKETVLAIGDLEVNTATRTAKRGGSQLLLQAREYALLEYLIRRAGQVVTRTEIEAHIYDSEADPVSNVVDSAICALRRKLDTTKASPLIHTRRGVGYILQEDNA